jgi:RNA polymerase sigma-70 factor (ECF subfamily)
MPVPDESGRRRIIRELMEGRHVQENFRALFETYYPAVRGFFARRGFGPEDARDLAQDVFVAVHTSIGTLREPDAFAGWIFAIARHMAARHVERARGGAQISAATAHGGEVEPRSSDPSPLHSLLEQEKTDVMRAAIEELPERMRECLRARLMDDLNYREIGERLGISENTVAVQMHRAVKAVRSRLKGFFSDESSREEF